MTHCLNSAESCRYINTLLLPFFIGLDFVSVCALNGDVDFRINDGRTHALLAFCLVLHFSVLFRCVFVFVRDTQSYSVKKTYNNQICKERVT